MRGIFYRLTAHCLRHTIRDLFRAVECQIDLIDQIKGWKSVNSIGNSCGKGPATASVKNWLEVIKMKI